MAQPGEGSWIFEPPAPPESSTMLRKRNIPRESMTIDVPDIHESTSPIDSKQSSPQTPSPRRHGKSPKKVRFDDRHQDSNQKFLSRSLEVAYGLIHGFLLRPLKEMIALVFVYILGFVIAIAVIAYFFHVVKILLPGFLRLPGLSRGFQSVIRWSTPMPSALVCATTGKLCPPSGQLLNVTYSAKEEIRQASKVLNTLDRFEPSKSNLMSQSVNIDTLGDAAQYLSELEDRDMISKHLYNLADKVKKTGRATSKLESAGKNVMSIVLSLYDQLEIKLQGTKSGKYTEAQLLKTRDDLQSEIMRHLESLQKQIEDTIHTTDGVYDLSKRLRGVITKEVGAAESKMNELQIAKSSWGAKLRGAIQWDALSDIQRKTVKRDLDLMELALVTVDATKRGLNELTISLDAFFEAVTYAKKKNTGAIYMGLDVEDLLKSYHDDLEEARKKISGWD